MSQGEPKVLGRYEITGEIGRGMMGVIYRAVDPVLGRTVALKTVNIRLAAGDEDRASFEARFMTEARAAALLSHPAIVTVHDLGRDADTETLYIALEHLEGRTLADVVREDGPLPWRQALAIGGRIAGALDHAHGRGIIHRDVKPANIMVLPGGDPIEDVLAGRPARHREGWATAAPAPAAAPGPAAALTGDVWIRGVDRLGWRALTAIGTCLILIVVASAVLRQPPGMPAATDPASLAPPAPAPARLEVSFRHPFKVGTVRVWVDGALALEETVPGRVTRDFLAIKLRRGTFKTVLDVPPGEHVVRVQVDDGDKFRESRRIRATFASGEVRRLDAAVGGVLQKDLALVWSP